ncbi:MAG: RNA-binding transcriptional accessory protein, partial [Melioribacteraceae bacterium]|nr:RNA-binding transcriptional accessory protein [Melioribacteraceae bacterium]
MNIPREIAVLLNISEEQVLSTIALLNEDATVPFIARYRKEKTGGLDEEQIREIEDKFTYFNLLENRKETVIKSIEEQGKLTDELKNKILSASKLQEVEDLYLPYKPKRKTRGTIAKAKGLEPLAIFIINNPGFSDDFEEILIQYINDENGVSTSEEALQGAKDIIAEMISDDADVRSTVRNYFLDNTSIVSQKAKIKSEDQSKKKKDVYDIYHDFKIELSKIKPYQLLAINRGEKEKFLKVNFSFDKDDLLIKIFGSFFDYRESIFIDILRETVDDSFTRLINPSVEREIRNQLTEIADQHAIEIF